MSFSLTPRGPFSLARAAAFGFGPREGAADTEVMRLAFNVEGTEESAAVVLRQDAEGVVHAEVDGGANEDAVARQVARILSLDHDGEEWLRVGERDPVLGGLQREHHGLRPVLFHSPYEGACWAVVATRRARPQAQKLRDGIARELGSVFTLEGEELVAWPGPRALLDGLEPRPGFGEEPVRRLRGIAEAAIRGELDAAALRALAPDEARERVGQLRGLGPFYSQLVTVRSVGFTDALPSNEKRSMAAAAEAYGLDAPPEGEDWVAFAERWRPFRTWAVVLLRVAAG